MDRCLNCQFYDRKREKTNGGQSLRWGQCRRTAPLLNPAQGKSYAIEGVWPTVRDDDWCGEWKVTMARPDMRRPEPHAIAVGPREAVNGSVRAMPINGSGSVIAVTTGSQLSAPPVMAVASVGGE